jgi:cytochrome c peroxidase
MPTTRAWIRYLLLPLLILTLSADPRDAAAERLEPIRPIPPLPSVDPRLSALGASLFHDPRLSADNRLSCASCHDLGRNGGAGGLATQTWQGLKVPTVFNAVLSFTQFWDGRAETLAAAIDTHLQDPSIMGASWPRVMARLRGDRQLVAQMHRLFSGGLSPNAVVSALTAFKRTLLTPDSRFDRWLAGEDGALNPLELRGYRLFKSYGCASCHQGAAVGGNMYGRMGVMDDYFAARGDPITHADLGRFNWTGLEEDRHLFKVPSLRLAVLNPPYFHDRSATNLANAIRIMARYQLGRPIPDEHVGAIISFLGALVGEHPRLRP